MTVEAVCELSTLKIASLAHLFWHLATAVLQSTRVDLRICSAVLTITAEPFRAKCANMDGALAHALSYKLVGEFVCLFVGLLACLFVCLLGGCVLF